MEETQSLVDTARSVLSENDRGDYTVPAKGLYPHQWLWDSCFIAIGLRHLDVDRAKSELVSLLRGQWSNGMLPHMIFAGGEEHQRDRNIWRSWLNPHAPDKLATSGITQPPMLAEAVVRVGDKMTKSERRTWYQTVYPALLAYHQWLYAERDPHKEGLAVQIHPWETGLDNTPPWMAELHDHQLPWWIRLLRILHLSGLISLVRRDTISLGPGERLSNVEALALFSMQRRLRRKAYDIDRILSHSLLLAEDLTFNCILIRANYHLVRIAHVIKRELPDDLRKSMKRSEDALDQLWDAYAGQYFSRNFVSHKLLKEPSIAALMPLYAGCVTKERAKQLVESLNKKSTYGAKYPVPSVPLNSPYFKPHTYWQGPVWINTNWLIIDGLERYGYKEEADQIRASSLKLIENSGCNEYFSPIDGSPAGAHNFSWTAALAIDLINYT